MKINENFCWCRKKNGQRVCSGCFRIKGEKGPWMLWFVSHTYSGMVSFFGCQHREQTKCFKQSRKQLAVDLGWVPGGPGVSAISMLNQTLIEDVAFAFNRVIILTHLTCTVFPRSKKNRSNYKPHQSECPVANLCDAMGCCISETFSFSLKGKLHQRVGKGPTIPIATWSCQTATVTQQKISKIPKGTQPKDHASRKFPTVTCPPGKKTIRFYPHHRLAAGAPPYHAKAQDHFNSGRYPGVPNKFYSSCFSDVNSKSCICHWKAAQAQSENKRSNRQSEAFFQEVTARPGCEESNDLW